MGASFSNCHVRSNNAKQCGSVVASLIRTRALLTEPKNGWISIYDETSESQNLDELARITKGLSAKLATDAFAFLVHDDDVFLYQAYRKGKLVDQFNSRPDYFGEVSAAERKKWSGNWKKLIPLAPAGTTVEKIQRVLRKKTLFAQELAASFAAAMGISKKHATTGFRYLQEGANHLRLIHSRKHSPLDAALLESVDKGDATRVHDLLAQGVSPNLQSRFGEPVLSYAIRFHRREIAFALIDAGADRFSPAESHAIWAAAAHGEPEVMARLLQTNSPQLKGCLPIALISAVQMGHAEIVGDLLKAGADPDACRADGFTPLMSACFRGLEVMWEMFAGRETPQKRDWTGIVRALLDAGADVNRKAANGATALALAKTTNQAGIIEMLQAAGAEATAWPTESNLDNPALRSLRAKLRRKSETANEDTTTGVPIPGKAHLDPRVREAFRSLRGLSCQPKKK